MNASKFAPGGFPACAVDPAGRDGPVIRDARFVECDRVVGGAAARGVHGYEAAVAVSEDQPGTGSRADRFHVLAFPGDAVAVALRAAAAAAAPLQDVHGVPLGEQRGECGQVGGHGEHPGDYDDVRPAARAEVLDGRAVCGGHYLSVQIKHVFVSLVRFPSAGGYAYSTA